MPNCKYLEGCDFFKGKLADMPRPANLYKDLYCFNDYSICARYLVAEALGRDAVPGDLFPNHEKRAGEIIDRS